MQHFLEGLDPTGLTCISAADLLQMIRSAKPYPNQGLVIYSQTAPDVVANPELAFFIWGELDGSDVPTGDFYYYNGTSWELLPIIDGSKLAPHSVGLDKIDLTLASPFYIIQVNANGDALIWTSIISAIQNNTLPVAKLVAPDNTNNYVLTCLLGTRAFRLLSDFVTTDIADNTIPIAKLVRAGADALGLYLRTKIDGSGVEWARIDVANLGAVGSSASQAIRRNAGNTAWEFFTPSTLAFTTLDNGGSYYAIPAINSARTIAHGLAVVPKLVRTVLVCTSTDAGYAVNDEIDISGVTGDQDGTNQWAAFTIGIDVTNITVARGSDANGSSIAAKTGGTTAIDFSKWGIKLYLMA